MVRLIGCFLLNVKRIDAAKQLASPRCQSEAVLWADIIGLRSVYRRPIVLILRLMPLKVCGETIGRVPHPR